MHGPRPEPDHRQRSGRIHRPLAEARTIARADPEVRKHSVILPAVPPSEVKPSPRVQPVWQYVPEPGTGSKTCRCTNDIGTNRRAR